MFKNAVALCLLICPLAFAQDFRASLIGVVTDPSGAAIEGASVVAKATDTGAESRGLTNAEGRYQIPFLTPGAYTVTIEKQGFHRLVREGIRLQVSEKANADFTLTLGEVNQSVSVTAATDLVQTESAD